MVLSLVPSWDFNKAFLTGLITAATIYAAALFVDKRRRNYEMFVLGSLRKRIKEMEGLKARLSEKSIKSKNIIIYYMQSHSNSKIKSQKAVTKEIVYIEN